MKSPFDGLVFAVPAIVGFRGIVMVRSSSFLLPGVNRNSNSAVLMSSFGSMRRGMSRLVMSGVS